MNGHGRNITYLFSAALDYDSLSLQKSGSFSADTLCVERTTDYDGNQLQRVEDNAIKLLYNGSMDFKDSVSFDPGKDIIIMAGIKDISKIGLLVGNIVDTYSEDFSKTKLINYED